MTRRISVLNMKGGVGKTTLAVNLSHTLARRGIKTLLVDCDLQSNSSSLLPEIEPPTLTHVLTQRAQITEAIRPARDNLDLLPADRNLDTASAWIISQGRRAYFQFRTAIESLTHYDVMLFDLAPSYSQVAEAVLLASQELLVPCELQPYSVEGLLHMLTKLEENLPDHPLVITGIIPSQLDQRYSMTADYLKQIQNIFKERVTPAIRTDSALSRAQAYHQTIFEFAPESKAAQDFTALASHLFAEVTAHA